LVRRQDR